jgi:hypothetical protein
MKTEQNVPKRRHIKFRRRGITQKKAYNGFRTKCGIQMSIYDEIATWSLSIILISVLGLVIELFNKNKILLANMLQASTKEGCLVLHCLDLSKHQ